MLMSSRHERNNYDHRLRDIRAIMRPSFILLLFVQFLSLLVSLLQFAYKTIYRKNGYD